jgi:hypothetical protein
MVKGLNLRRFLGALGFQDQGITALPTILKELGAPTKADEPENPVYTWQAGESWVTNSS